MWLRNTYEGKVDITPKGEEHQHIPEPTCQCMPQIETDAEKRLVIIHNSYDRREEFEEAAAMLPPSTRYGRAA